MTFPGKECVVLIHVATVQRSTTLKITGLPHVAHSQLANVRFLLLGLITVADLPDIFFLELATRLEYKAVQILAMRFTYYKRVLNICNV